MEISWKKFPGPSADPMEEHKDQTKAEIRVLHGKVCSDAGSCKSIGSESESRSRWNAKSFIAA